jgi:hypothetical protein
MKSLNKVVIAIALLGTLSPVAQAASITIGSLTVATPGNMGSFASASNLGIGDTGLIINPNLSNSSTTATKTFFDDFVFTISNGVTLNSFMASLQTASFAGIAGFSESLYAGNIPGTSFSTTGANPLAASSLLATTTTNSLLVNNLAAGTYTLQFSGTLAKAGSLLGVPVPTVGTYASLVSISPVPEEDTYAMMLAGLGMMGFMVRRSKSEQV